MIFFRKFPIYFSFFKMDMKFRKWALSQLTTCRCAMFWNLWKNNFPIFIFLRNGWLCTQILRKFGERFLRTWFRNANQCYSITSWLWRFNPKASAVECEEQRFPRTGGFGGGAPLTQEIFGFFFLNLFLLRNLMTFF